ncbi:hypothetical protein C0992_013223, partial [Termitomyces sp. T32_za158]
APPPAVLSPLSPHKPPSMILLPDNLPGRYAHHVHRDLFNRASLGLGFVAFEKMARAQLDDGPRSRRGGMAGVDARNVVAAGGCVYEEEDVYERCVGQAARALDLL